MEKIRLITDSTATLSDEILAACPEVGVVPLYVHFGQTSYQEGVTLKPAEFFPLLTHSSELPTTSQPSPGDFLSVYKPLVEDGCTVISVHISSKISGTVDSARAAQEMAGGRIEVVDSLQTGMGLGFQVLEGVRAIRAGFSFELVLARIKAVQEGIYNLFVVDTLEYLRRGGRISGTQALVGSILQVKPILAFRDGRIESMEKIPTKKRAMARIIHMLDQARTDHPNAKLHLAVHEGAAYEEGSALLAELKEKWHADEAILASLGATIGTHTGPGVIGIAFWQEENGQVIPAALT